MRVAIPRLLKAEHKELHAELLQATKARGKIGEAARAVAKLLHPHFVKEEEYALAPLALLPLLAEGKFTQEMRNALRMTDRLQAELPQMLQEHKAIIAALKNLSRVAKKEERTEYARFAEKLIQHAKTEEEILYPAAMLVGEYLELRMQQ